MMGVGDEDPLRKKRKVRHDAVQEEKGTEDREVHVIEVSDEEEIGFDIVEIQSEEITHVPEKERTATLSDRNDENVATKTREHLRLTEAPVYRPTAEEFKNPILWIRKMTHKMVKYGIVKIVPPAGWNPPSPFSRINRKKKFATYRQSVHELNISDKSDKIVDGSHYTPSEYRMMALMFEKEWRERNNDVRTVEDVESFFWKTVGEQKPRIMVEYGANLSPEKMGSGFHRSRKEGEVEKDSTLGPFDGWNLNTIGYAAEDSLLGLECKGDISGITMPWIYFGMLFASFAWHVEDNHLFSINYMHQGAPKTWYGVPSVAAEAFDKVCEKVHGKSKHFLRKLNLLMPPESFLKEGVPITHTLQEPGQFIITCPRAYHAGFSHGFNVGEAVNFATIEWIPWGIKCREMYHAPVAVQDEYRHSVFNVDSLFFKIINMMLKKDMSYWMEHFTKECVEGLIGQLKVLSSDDRENGDLLRRKGAGSLKMKCTAVEDEEYRECKYCKASAFTSVLICPCQHDKTVCLKHYSKLCSCDIHKKTIITWYTPEELDDVVRRFQRKIDEFDDMRKRSSSTARSMIFGETACVIAKSK